MFGGGGPAGAVASLLVRHGAYKAWGLRGMGQVKGSTMYCETMSGNVTNAMLMAAYGTLQMGLSSRSLRWLPYCCGLQQIMRQSNSSLQQIHASSLYASMSPARAALHAFVQAPNTSQMQ